MNLWLPIYPINSWVSTTNENDDKSVTILTDRSSGASSITNDTIEIMIHRRLLDDDAFGVAQPLNETEFGKGLVARGTHYLLFDPSPEDQILRTRLLAKSIFASPIVTLNNQEEGSEIVQTSPGAYQLPANVHLLTLAIIPETEQLLVRLEHFFSSK